MSKIGQILDKMSAEQKAKRYTFPCDECGAEFVTASKQRKYCSVTCAHKRAEFLNGCYKREKARKVNLALLEGGK